MKNNYYKKHGTFNLNRWIKIACGLVLSLFINNANGQCSGSPSPAGTVSAAPMSISGSGSSTLNLTGYDTNSGITLQWQSSPSSMSSGGVYSNVTGGSGVATDSYTSGTITSTTNYSCLLTCTNTGDTSRSNEVVVTISPAAVTLTTNLYLEGYYTGGGLMDNYGLGGCLYSLGISPNFTDVDTVKISVMNAATFALVESKKGILQTNGNVTVTFGAAVIPGNSYFIKVNHRSSIETWSASAITMTAATSYDFTVSASMAYGNNMKDIGAWWGEASKLGLIGGDVDQNGVINFLDSLIVAFDIYISNGGYAVTDLTGDGYVESSDWAIFENNYFFGYTFHAPFNLNDSNACTIDSYNPTTSTISHTPVNINDGDSCTTDACDPATGTITHLPFNINDNDYCTTDACDPATGAISHFLVNIDDGNVCTEDACNSSTGVVTHSPTPCPVTTGDILGYDCPCPCEKSAGTQGGTDGTGELAKDIDVSAGNPIGINGNGFASQTTTFNNSDTICSGDSIILTATSKVHYSNYTWSPAAGLNTASGPTVIASPNVTTTYTVTGTISNMCPVSKKILITVNTCGNVTLNLRLFIEGYYGGAGLMDNFGAGGCLFVNNVANSTSIDADTIKISMIDPVAFTTIDTKTGILHTNGNMTVSFDPSVLVGSSYYIKVKHRNAIESWSSNPVIMAAVTSYDFTDAQSKAYGNNQIQTSDSLHWAFYSGDISDAGTSQVGIQDGIIESQDYSDMENAVFIIKIGYEPEDITGDGIVESLDYSIMENNVYYVILSMHP